MYLPYMCVLQDQMNINPADLTITFLRNIFFYQNPLILGNIFPFKYTLVINLTVNCRRVGMEK